MLAKRRCKVKGGEDAEKWETKDDMDESCATVDHQPETEEDEDEDIDKFESSATEKPPTKILRVIGESNDNNKIWKNINHWFLFFVRKPKLIGNAKAVEVRPKSKKMSTKVLCLIMSKLKLMLRCSDLFNSF